MTRDSVPPGWYPVAGRPGMVVRPGSCVDVESAWATVEDDSRAAVVAFAERVAAWLAKHENADIDDRVPIRDRLDIAQAVLAAARGELEL